MPTDFSLGEAMYDTSGREVAPGGFLYQPHAADYLGGMSVPGSGYGGGYGGGYVRGAGGGLLGGSPSVTYTPPTGAGAPGGAIGVGPPSVTYTPPTSAVSTAWGDADSPGMGLGLAPDRDTYMGSPMAYGSGYVGAPGAFSWTGPASAIAPGLVSPTPGDSDADSGDEFGGYGDVIG